jgi:hypothetical protein
MLGSLHLLLLGIWVVDWFRYSAAAAAKQQDNQKIRAKRPHIDSPVKINGIIETLSDDGTKSKGKYVILDSYIDLVW